MIHLFRFYSLLFFGPLAIVNAVDRVDRSGEFDKKKTQTAISLSFGTWPCVEEEIGLQFKPIDFLSRTRYASLSMEKERPTLLFEITTEPPNSDRRFPSAIGDAYQQTHRCSTTTHKQASRIGPHPHVELVAKADCHPSIIHPSPSLLLSLCLCLSLSPHISIDGRSGKDRPIIF